MKETNDIKHIAIPFYSSEESYKAVAKMLEEATGENPGNLSYGDYLKRLETLFRELKESGKSPHKIEINPVALECWINDHNVPLSQEIISAYATQIMGDRVMSD